MPLFNYQALNKSGEQISGIIDASDINEAKKKIRNSGLFLTSIKPETVSSPSVYITKKLPLFGRTSTDQGIFFRQLATLIKAGISLTKALTTLIESSVDQNFRKTMLAVRDHIERGASFSTALSMFPAEFSTIALKMVEAGETAGELGTVLDRIADLYEKQSAIRRKIRSATAYPLFISIVGAGVVLFLFAWVIPVVVKLFMDMNAVLPLPTKILIAISELLHHYWYLLIAIIFLIYVGYRQIKRTKGGLWIIDSLKLKLPIFGDLILKSSINRVSRSLALLLKSGLPILEALKSTMDLAGNEVIKKALSDAYEKIATGSDIASPLKASQIFPPIAVNMIETGEESGRLEEMLEKLGDNYESEIETKLQTVMSLLEPIMILLMGVIVGFVVISVLLPLFEMSRIIR